MSRKTSTHPSATMKALVHAAELRAEDLGDALTGPEHLLLAALEFPDGEARRAFVRIGADPDAFRSAIEEVHAGALRAIGIETVPEAELGRSVTRHRDRLSKPAVVTLKRAGDEARRDRTRTFGLPVVAAVAQLAHGTAPRALAVMGVDRHELLVAARVESVAASEAQRRRA